VYISFGELKDRRGDLGEAVQLGKRARGVADPAMAPRRFRQQVLRAARRLQGWHR
jgi:hypothetical protein